MPGQTPPEEPQLNEGVHGVHANPVLLSLVNDTIGKDVLVETSDGAKFTGIFAGCSETFDIGLTLAHKVPETPDANFIPQRGDVVDKMQFNYGDIICISTLMNDEKAIKGFATDREYHAARNGSSSDMEDLQKWDADEEELIEHGSDLERTRGSQGWGVEQMFHQNERLGVVSTFETNLSQYTTVEVVGNDEDRKKAESIAREIENAPQSKIRARLENDDEERDLDKQTSFEDEQPRNARGGNNQRGRGNARGTGVPLAATNRKAEALKDGGARRTTGVGSQSARTTELTFSKSSGGTHPHQVGKHSSPAEKRPTGSSIIGDFEDWQKDKEMGGTPRNVPPTSTRRDAPNGGIRRDNYSSRDGGSANSGTSPSTGVGGPRVEGLRQWNNTFTQKYRSDPAGSKPAPQAQNEANNNADRTPRNAWNHGPPSGLRTDQRDHLLQEAIELEASREETASSPLASNTTANTTTDSKPPVDPKPASDSAADATDSSKTANGSNSEKFKFNPDAKPFTPKSLQPDQPQPPSTPMASVMVPPLAQSSMQQQMLMYPTSAQPNVYPVQPMAYPYPMMMNGQQIMPQQTIPQGVTPTRGPVPSSQPPQRSLQQARGPVQVSNQVYPQMPGYQHMVQAPQYQPVPSPFYPAQYMSGQPMAPPPYQQPMMGGPQGPMVQAPTYGRPYTGPQGQQGQMYVMNAGGSRYSATSMPQGGAMPTGHDVAQPPPNYGQQSQQQQQQQSSTGSSAGSNGGQGSQPPTPGPTPQVSQSHVPTAHMYYQPVYYPPQFIPNSHDNTGGTGHLEQTGGMQATAAGPPPQQFASSSEYAQYAQQQSNFYQQQQQGGPGVVRQNSQPQQGYAMPPGAGQMPGVTTQAAPNMQSQPN